MFSVRSRSLFAVLLVAALAATAAIAAPSLVRAATTTVWSVDFDDSSAGDWSQSGRDGSTLSYVADPDDSNNTVLSVVRTADFVGIESPTGLFTPGETYTFSMRARLADPAAGTADIRFVMKPAYTWIANTTGIDASGWTTVTDEFTVPGDAVPGDLSVYLGTSDASTAGATYTYLVDDILVTTESDGGGVEPPPACTPSEVTFESIDFGDSTTGTWIPNGGPTLTYVAGGTDALVLNVADRTNTYLRRPAVGDWRVRRGRGVHVLGRHQGERGLRVRFIANEPGADNEYVWVGNASAAADEWVTISGTHTFGAGAADAKIYIEVAELLDYQVDNVVVTYLDTCEGAPTVPQSDLYASDGDYSAEVTDRVSQGSGLGFPITDELVTGTTYENTAWVRFAEGAETDDIWLSLQRTTESGDLFDTLGQFTGITNSGWTEVTASFTPAAFDSTLLYFETAYDGGNTGNMSTFYVDDISVVVPEPPVVEDLTPMMDTVPFPLGVAIDSRETVGSAAELLLRHFDQITPENYMKPEAWYDGDGNWAPSSGEIDALMDFAVDNDLRLYGHVLVWHSQTPDFFFEDASGNPLTTSDTDKQILRDRMRDHIFNVAQYLHDGWGDFGGDNPLVAWDVVNEVIDDSAAYSDGTRRSEWYRILGEEFVDLSFEYADEAFNEVYAAPGADRPVTLFINDYNTEQDGKRGRYLALIDRLLDRGVPIDGVGHQFHVSLAMPVSALEDAIVDTEATGLIQAVTELDVTTGTPESEAKFINQGYYYRDAFEIFRSYTDDMYSVTIWGLIDSRSWRDANGGPLVFDDGLRAKPAYYGIVEGEGTEEPLPNRLRTANVFAGDVAIASGAPDAPEWDRLPLLNVEGVADFQLRWAADHLTAYIEVEDATDEAADEVEFQVGSDTYTVGRDGSGGLTAVAQETAGGYVIVASIPLSPTVAEGDTLDFDVRVTDGADTVAWNSPGVLGTLTLVEAVSFAEVPQAWETPVIDGVMDAVWADAASVQTLKAVSGSGGAVGTFHLLWDGDTLYIYAEVDDDVVDVTGSDPWIQDSVEIYVDGGNVKNGSYRYDDTQIRINAENVVSFGTGDETFQANRVESATSIGADGYVVEAAINLLSYSGLGTFHGLDVQVNDATGGARDAIRNWADPTGAGYQSTARWGVIELVEGADAPAPTDPPSEDDLNDGNRGSVNVPAQASVGDTIPVFVGPAYVGDEVTTYFFSDPVLLGTNVVPQNGVYQVTLPSTAPLGEHRVAVYDAQGGLLGWDSIELVSADGELAFTGAEGSGWVTLAILLVAAGSAFLVVSHATGNVRVRR